MQIEIYGDIFFLINFIMDLIIFWTGAKFLRRKIKFYKILFGALSTTILYCIAVFNSYYDIKLMFLILIIGVIITFRPDNFLALIKIIFLIHGIAFIIGGMTIALFYYIDFYYLFSDVIFFKLQNFSFKILLASSFIFFVLIKLLASYIKKAVLSKQVFYQINICLGKKKSSFNALVDTGNSLYDNLTGRHIIIAQLDKIKNIFPDEILFAIKTNNLEKLILYNKIKFNLVPFKSIGNEHGILICFCPDQINILSDSNKKIFISDALIGICNFSLSKHYFGLINPNLLA